MKENVPKSKSYALQALKEAKKLKSSNCCLIDNVQLILNEVNRQIYNKTYNLIMFLNSNPIV